MNVFSLAILLLVANVNAKDEYGQAVSVNEFQSFWMDAMDVLEDLDHYQKLWIKPHACVWSECAVDDTDDGYVGDNRDGDEQWYQYRTQNFCANAAYSLYGQKKGGEIGRCNRRHYINSFFTYGGADTLLWSIGETPVDYLDGYNNSECVETDYYDENRRRLSGSDSNEDDGYTATLGCSAEGKYVIAAFQSSSCDGNYFTGIVDEFQDYNKQQDSIGCHKIYQKSKTTDQVIALLSNSWSCDLRLYPNGCPDPYGKKKEFDFAIRTVMHGGNPQRAYNSMIRRTPIRVTSWILLAITALITVVTYLWKNESRVESKGGRNLRGYSRCLMEDLALGCRTLGESMTKSIQKLKERRKKRKLERGKQERRSSDDSDTEDEDISTGFQSMGEDPTRARVRAKRSSDDSDTEDEDIPFQNMEDPTLARVKAKRGKRRRKEQKRKQKKESKSSKAEKLLSSEIKSGHADDNDAYIHDEAMELKKENKKNKKKSKKNGQGKRKQKKMESKSSKADRLLSSEIKSGEADDDDAYIHLTDDEAMELKKYEKKLKKNGQGKRGSMEDLEDQFIDGVIDGSAVDFGSGSWFKAQSGSTVGVEGLTGGGSGLAAGSEPSAVPDPEWMASSSAEAVERVADGPTERVSYSSTEDHGDDAEDDSDDSDYEEGAVNAAANARAKALDRPWV